MIVLLFSMMSMNNVPQTSAIQQPQRFLSEQPPTVMTFTSAAMNVRILKM